MELIDISNWQAGLSLADVKAAGKSGVICKASEGITYTDPTYAGFRAQAASQSLIFGSYHYARPDVDTAADARQITIDAKAEAAYYLAASMPAEGDMVALDYEKASSLTASQQELWVATWLSEVEDATGQKPLLYTNPSFWSTEVGGSQIFGAYPLWLALWGVNDGTRYPASPISGWSVIAMHQYTSKGSIAGKDIDLDYIAPTFEVASLQIGLQPTTVGDPFGPPFKAIAKDGSVLATSQTRTTAFTDFLYDEVAKTGESKLQATRRMA